MRELILRAAQMGVTVTELQADALEEYGRMLLSANARQNLIAPAEDPREVLYRHILDSLTPLAGTWPQNVQTLIDVGSGAGLPGIPLSILLPETRVVLLDAQQKRVAFLREVIGALRLNAEAVQGRAEELARVKGVRESFDVAVARAVAALPLLAEYLLPFVRVGGCMLALKGPAAASELDEAAFAIQTLGGGNARVLEAAVPGRAWEHTVVLVEKLAPAPERYPRRTGIPEKRPLKK